MLRERTFDMCVFFSYLRPCRKYLLLTKCIQIFSSNSAGSNTNTEANNNNNGNNNNDDKDNENNNNDNSKKYQLLFTLVCYEACVINIRIYFHFLVTVHKAGWLDASSFFFLSPQC